MRLTARKGNAAVNSQTAIIESNAEQPPASGIAASDTVATDTPRVARVKETEEPEEEGVVIVRSPMKGTFYRAAAPGESPFCDAGQHVGPDDTVCLVEIMKLFNSIPASVSGTVERFFVENADPVDLNQAIVSIRPD